MRSPAPFLLLAVLAACSSAPPAPEAGGSRVFELRYAAILPPDLDPEAGPVRLWVPVPVDDGRQRVKLLERPAEASFGGPDMHGNRFSFVELAASPAAAEGEDGEQVEGPPEFQSRRRRFTWRWRVVRSVDHGGLETGPRRLEDEVRQGLYLRPNRLVPVSGMPARIAAEVSAGLQDPFAVARALYDRVLEDMEYSKHGEGWGQGSAEWACSEHYGNCTDFHAYFIAMARSLGIPARFQIGFPLPPERGEGTIPGYHCWAHFFVPGHGWIPVDISEADKHPGKAEFYFGHLDADRVAFSFGRDLILDPPQAGEPLNFFVYAYAEQGGRPLPGVGTEVSYRDLE